MFYSHPRIWGLPQCEDFRALNQRITNGFDVNHRFEEGWVLLHSAAIYAHPKCMQLLLKHGANPNVLAGDLHRTPLHLAVEVGATQCVSQLLAAKANPHAITRYHQTALHYATSKRHVNIVRMLLDAGANVDYMQIEHRCSTCLTVAAQNDDQDCAELLLDRGAKIEYLDVLPGWLQQLIIKRSSVKNACLIFYGILRFRYRPQSRVPKDMVRLLSFAIWATRFNSEWELKANKK